MGISKKKATANNIIISFIYQFITIILGFLIPQLFLSTYGPEIHGLTSAITNIMSYVLLLTAGLNTASIQALYSPLSKNDHNRINEVLNAVNKFYIQIGIIFSIVILLIALILPNFINNISWSVVFSLMFVMGLQTILDSFLVSKYRILLRADQKLYITVIFNIIVLILRGIIQIVLILNKSSVILVQAIPSIMIFVTWIMQKLYVQKHYPKLDSKVKADKKALSKRWSAFVHQIAGLVVNNTDVVLLTLVTGNMVLVSVYSVYQLVFSHLYKFMTTIFSLGSVASFGHLMATGKRESLVYNYNLYEFVYFNILSIVYSITAVMILPFVKLYTSSVDNVVYANQKLAVLFVLIGIANNLRVPGGTLINAGGYYKETQWRAVTEAIINFVVSIILIFPYGIYGVLFGTIASFMYRTIDIIFYSNKNILNRSPRITILRSFKVLFIIIINVILFNKLLNINITNWNEWVILATCVGVFSTVVIIIINLLDEKEETKDTFKIVIKLLTKMK